jgi:hypothetical protein
MRLSKKITHSVMLLSVLLIAGCQNKPDFYAPREACLTQLIEQCKAGGWKYASTNSTCDRIATDGIYGLTAAQLQTCQDKDQNIRF